ncbi:MULTISPECIES: N-acetylmuramoyl-L-alanine amidase family protein [Bizionia]|uniref:N-acetylmuramoyl-L-alanine amidase n=1 Tax=Bizionia algoritergicola TaxID=291187 RepID=A0A5D0QYJ9_9FLAO|nr:MULTISPECIES: N-acetylmuramoyl-L-alanine amidase [Bizionia]OBX21461.1 N-acetylmuramoyl-L-alanine amidase [Bizionia sp. APA-3]TYB73711.1 N-acetylmuramoyl-L-alanine amidase [Bizionia algoritergicola]
MKTNTYISFLLFTLLLTVSSVNSVFSQSKSDKFVVVLDAGHGGHDPGNLGNGYKEKNIALNIVLEVGKELEKNKDIEVIYTRKTDVFLKLRERAAIANKADADLFVSVHCNAHSKSSAYGTETFVLGLHANEQNFNIAKKENEVIFLEDDYEKHYEGFDPNSPESLIGLTLMQEEFLDQSIQLASYIETNFTGKLNRKSRGVKQAGFWVLHNTYMPSVLIETGFLTYKPEGAYLNSGKGQHEMSMAIKEAILHYKNNLDSNVGDSFQPEKLNESIANAIKTTEIPDIYEGITFKIQIAASSRNIVTKPYNFKGLDPISKTQIGNLYKYYFGNTSDYNMAKQYKDEADAKGYDGCFIVAFKNGELIPLANVLKTSAN